MAQPRTWVWCSEGLSQGDRVKYPKKLLYCLHPPYSQNSHSPIHHITFNPGPSIRGDALPEPLAEDKDAMALPTLGVSHNKVLSETPGASGNARTSALKPCSPSQQHFRDRSCQYPRISPAQP